MALKGRYYEELIRNQGFERATQSVLRELIEQHNVLEKNLVEMAQGISKMTDILSSVVDMGSQLKNAHTDILKRMGNETDEDNPIVEH